MNVPVLLAIVAGQLPTWPINDTELHISLRGGELMDHLKDVCSCCWKDKEERASMSEIAHMLDNIQG